MGNESINRSDILRDILHIARTELNENGSIGYTMPDNNHHIYIYVDDLLGPDDLFYIIEPNRVVDGAHEPMGDTAVAKYNDFSELLLGCSWCLDLFERDNQLNKVYTIPKLQSNSFSAVFEEIFEDIKSQITGHINETAYGEPQAYIYLDNERSIEITLEQDGLEESEYFYSIRLHCNELEEDIYHSSVGIIDQHCTGTSDINEIKAILPVISAVNESIPVPNPDLDITTRAALLLEETLQRPSGAEVFALANVLYSLKEDTEDLSEESRIILAQKILEATGNSVIPLLTAERIDAVRVLISEGIDPNRVPEFPETSADKMTDLLLNCDIDIFIEIVDTVALSNQSFYAPDIENLVLNQDRHQQAIDAILSTNNKKVSLSEKIRSAAERTASEDIPKTSEKEMLIFMINTYVDEKYGTGDGKRAEIEKDIITATGMTSEYYDSIKSDLDFIHFNNEHER